MSDAWYYAEGQKSVGPLTLKELKFVLSRLSDAGNVPVWRSGFPDWQRAAVVRELDEVSTPPPPILSGERLFPPSEPIAATPSLEKTKLATTPFALKLFIGACILMIFGWLLWPYYAVSRLSVALRDGDALALEDQVDWSSVREGLRGDLNATLVQKLRTEPDDNVGTGLATLLGPAIINQIVDSYFTPQTIAYLIRTGKPPALNNPSTTLNRQTPNFSPEQIGRLLAGSSDQNSPASQNTTVAPAEPEKEPPSLAILKYDGKSPSVLHYGDLVLTIGKDSDTKETETSPFFSAGRVTHAFFFGGPFTFKVELIPAQSELKSPLTMLFKWRGDWKLTRILLRADAFDQAGKDSSSGSTQTATASVQYKDHPAFSIQFDFDEPPIVDTQAVLRVMKLDPSTSVPQILFTHFTGGAHCCMATKIASMDKAGSWHVIDAGALDGDGYKFQDLDGNGGLVLISADNSFLYTFAPYAGSYAPTRIKKLNGASLDDVTAQKQYRAFLQQRLREMEASARAAGEETPHSNGFLGGWVAQKALVGEFAEAWRIMLSSYDRNSDWATLACARPLPLEQCPEAEQKRVGFPEALAAHLVAHQYISSKEAQQLASAPLDTASTKNTEPLSQGEIAALRRSLSHCWQPPPGIDARSSEYVVLRVLLKPDGTLKQEPVLVGGTPSPNRSALAVSAREALLRCQPFLMLKPEHYDQWKDLELTFNPHELLGG
jgi:hypothetical protein